MVWPCRTAASSNRTHTDLKEWSSVCNILTCFAFLRRTTSPGVRTAGFADAKTLVTISLKETGCFCFSITFVFGTAQYLQNCKAMAKMEEKKNCLFSVAKALGGTKTKVIKRVITKSQQESGNATYSISLSYGIYRRKKTDKQRA